MDRIEGVLTLEGVVTIVLSVVIMRVRELLGAQGVQRTSCLSRERHSFFFCFVFQAVIGHQQGCSKFALNSEKYLRLV